MGNYKYSLTVELPVEELVSKLAECDWCPITETSKIIGKKWHPVIIDRLLNGPKRFGEIKELISEISGKVLSDSLEDLEKEGIISRKVTSSRPVLIQYSLTEKGGDLEKVVRKMGEWGQKWLAPMEKPITIGKRVR